MIRQQFLKVLDSYENKELFTWSLMVTVTSSVSHDLDIWYGNLKSVGQKTIQAIW